MSSEPSSTSNAGQQAKLAALERDQTRKSIAYHEKQLEKYTSEQSFGNTLEWLEGMRKYHLRKIDELRQQLKQR